MSEPKSAGSMIAEARTKAGKSQRAVADAVGISVPYLSDIERGNRRPPFARWIVFSDALPSLNTIEFAEACLREGVVEVDARTLTDGQRRSLATYLVRAAEQR